MSLPTISVIHPTIRPAAAIEMRTAWLRVASHPERIEYLFVADSWDVDTQKALAAACADYAVAPGRGCIQAVNAGAARSTGNIIAHSADDFFPPVGWDDAICAAIGDASKPVALWVSDGLNNSTVTHPVMTRALYDLDGHVMDPCYDEADGIYADNDFTRQQQAAGFLIDARHIEFDHAWDPHRDAAMEAHNAPVNYRIGRELFLQRGRGANWGRIGVGCRIGGAPDPAFFRSWTGLIARGMREGDGILDPAVGLPHPAAVNLLFEQFLWQSDLDSLLLVDDDMVFAPDTLERLRAVPVTQSVGILAALASCGRAPFLPVALNVSTGRTVSGPGPIGAEVQGVECVGFAFTLIARDVLVAFLRQNGWDHNVCRYDLTLGEDGDFCKRAAGLGFSAAVAPQVRIGHRVVFTVTPGNDNYGPDFVFDTFGVGAT